MPPGGQGQLRGNIGVFMSLFSKGDAGDRFRVDGSDVTITVYCTCAQDFADVGGNNWHSVIT